MTQIEDSWAEANFDADAERDFKIECEVDNLEEELTILVSKFVDNGNYYKGCSERFFTHTVKALARILSLDANLKPIAEDFNRVGLSTNWRVNRKNEHSNRQYGNKGDSNQAKNN